MNAQEEITAAFAAKNWQIESYDYQSGNDEFRYEVSIDLDSYPDLAALPDAERWRLEDLYNQAFDAVGKQFQADGDSGTDCGPCILADRKTDVLRIAFLLADRLTLLLPIDKPAL